MIIRVSKHDVCRRKKLRKSALHCQPIGGGGTAMVELKKLININDSSQGSAWVRQAYREEGHKGIILTRESLK